MTKIKVEGPAATVIGKMLQKALEESGLKVSHWINVTPGGVANCRRRATDKGADVSIVSMTR